MLTKKKITVYKLSILWIEPIKNTIYNAVPRLKHLGMLGLVAGSAKDEESSQNCSLFFLEE